MPIIALEGSDGTTKETQCNILADLLISEGHTVKIFDFPQYSKLSSGPVREYLNGEYDTNPYQASVLFAVDRFDASFRIKKHLAQGHWIIFNRYVGSNMAHQGGRIADDAEREKFFQWLLEFEFGLMAIPKPDLSIILSLPLEECKRLIESKKERAYIKGSENKDIHEIDDKHLRNAIKIYKQIAQFPEFILLDISDESGKVLSRDVITQMIYNKIKEKKAVA